MTPTQLIASRFHHASAETRALNANIAPVATLTEEPQRKPREMNKTESRFHAMLQAKVRRGELREVRYEGMSLKWGGCMRYTPDFVVIPHDGKWIMIETKGKHEWSRDVVRWKGCRHEWSMHFEFQWWQEIERVWTRKM